MDDTFDSLPFWIGCTNCDTPLWLDSATHIWEKTADGWKETGPMHPSCASSLCDDDPTRFQMDEPEPEGT